VLWDDLAVDVKATRRERQMVPLLAAQKDKMSAGSLEVKLVDC
jgi:hypothetical protein